MMDIFMIVIGAAFGFVLCWFTKDNIIRMVTGTTAFIDRLDAKAKALRTQI